MVVFISVFIVYLFPPHSCISAHILDNKRITALAFKYLNRQSGQSPIHHCGLIQSGPVSQSELGLAGAPGQQPRHWQRAVAADDDEEKRKGRRRGRKAKKKGNPANEQTNSWREGDGPD